MSCHVPTCHIMSHHVMPTRMMLYSTVLYCTTRYNAMTCYGMLAHVISKLCYSVFAILSFSIYTHLHIASFFPHWLVHCLRLIFHDDYATTLILACFSRVVWRASALSDPLVMDVSNQMWSPPETSCSLRGQEIPLWRSRPWLSAASGREELPVRFIRWVAPVWLPQSQVSDYDCDWNCESEWLREWKWEWEWEGVSLSEKDDWMTGVNVRVTDCES